MMLFLLVALASLVKASPSSFFLRPSQTSSVSQFYLLMRLDAERVANFTSVAMAVNNPMHPLFSRYLTKQQVLDHIAPPSEHVATVVSHVKSVCNMNLELLHVEDRRDCVLVRARPSCVEKLFPGVRLARLNLHSGPLVLHPSSAPVDVPVALKSLVDMVVGVTDQVVEAKNSRKVAMLERRRRPVNKATDGYLYNYIWIGDMKRVYHIPTTVVKNPTRITQSVVEYVDQLYGTYNGEGFPSLDDLQMYQTLSGQSFNNISTIIGPWITTYDNSESTLDVDMQSLAQIPSVYITVNSSWMYGTAQELFSLPQTPSVNSVSYGTDEVMQCSIGKCKTQESIAMYIERCELELSKLAAIGVSVIVSSGDQGAVGRSNSDCSLDNTTMPLNPSYPGSSAWVTSVSGTTLVAAPGPVITPPAPICNASYPCGLGMMEFPCMINNTYYAWTTGGGFSQNIPMPVWQKELVYAYLTNENIPFPPAFTFNVNNRAFPDVSAFGSRLLIVQDKKVQVSAGTSASAPIISSIFALINDARVTAGKSPIGFWNPVLYLAKVRCPECFNTIGPGNNAQGQSANSICKYGFYSDGKSPFNAVTGLGSIRTDSMIKFVLSLP